MRQDWALTMLKVYDIIISHVKLVGCTYTRLDAIWHTGGGLTEERVDDLGKR